MAVANPHSRLAAAAGGAFANRVQKAIASLPDIDGYPTDRCAGDFQWRWYHMGSGHHFTNPYSPESWPHFFSDARWTSMNVAVLLELELKGYALSTIADLVRATKDNPMTPLPPVVEGGWNAVKSRGVFTLMNRQTRSWDQNTEILGLAWRSRREVRKCELMVDQLTAEAKALAAPGLDALWTKQLFAESSDPCGWQPTAAEVRFGVDSADAALEAAQAFRLGLEMQHGLTLEIEEEFEMANVLDTRSHKGVDLNPMPSLVGAEGYLEIYPCGAHSSICALSAVATGSEAGIRFPLMGGAVVFCPSALETEVQRLEIAAMEAAECFLPLANGLIGIGDGFFVIRINHYGQPAACIIKDRAEIVFSIVGAVKGKVINWRFLIFRGEVCDAIDMANNVNYI